MLLTYHALLRLVDVPEDVALDDVEAALLGLGDEVGPHVRRAPRVVDGAGEEDLPAAVDHERAAVVGDDGALLGELPRRRGAGGHHGQHGRGGERRGEAGAVAGHAVAHAVVRGAGSGRGATRPGVGNKERKPGG